MKNFKTTNYKSTKNLFILLICMFLLYSGCTKHSRMFESNWSSSVDRVWTGPDYWANPLQDWKISNGKLECLVTGPDRSLHLLTHVLENISGSFETTVNLGITEHALAAGEKGWTGFTIGTRGDFNNYRDDAVFGQGLHAGITSAGQLFIGQPDDIISQPNQVLLNSLSDASGVILELQLEKMEKGDAIIILSVTVPGDKQPLETLDKHIPFYNPEGNVALKADFSGRVNNPETNTSAWFSDWKVSGILLSHYPERRFGPILFAQYTYSKNIVKLTAQMAPVSAEDQKEASLEIQKEKGKWEHVATAEIDPMAYTATFRFETDGLSRDLPYRVAYSWADDPKASRNEYYEGIIRADPVEKEEIVVAAFTGNHDFAFPNREVVKNVLKHKPDLLVFTGDQIYEPRGGFGSFATTKEAPEDLLTLDYLRKWYMFGWEYGEMLRNIPAVIIPDDHDVYHGNIWGAGGKAAKYSDNNHAWQDDGGYKHPPEWVNMVQRTQTSHLPDPYDPLPALQGISVYYTYLNVGGISFAIIEDRKWKAAPKAELPDSLKVVNGNATNRLINDPDVLQLDADLLGNRQEKFLDDWVGDWSLGTIMKAVISQTLFTNLQSRPSVGGWGMPLPKPGEYPEDDIQYQSMDSNGWPKKGRNRALRIMRKGFALHIAGDTHLPATIQYGIDDWRDAGYAFVVPSICNYFPRRWFPSQEGKNREPGQERNMGDFYDGLGNKMSVYAVANPEITGHEPAILYDHKPGYGIIRFNKKTREIHLANWPRHTDPGSPEGKPYPGWPVVISQYDNFSKNAKAWLPDVNFSGLELPPVIKITNEKSGELEYAVRLKEESFQPKVFTNDTYIIEIGEPGTAYWKEFHGIASMPEPGTNEI